METVLDVAIGVRELIRRPENWCIESQAKTADGTDTYPQHPRAVSFCLVGAWSKVTRIPAVVGPVTQFANFLGFETCGHMVRFNNYNPDGHMGVINRLDEKIGAALGASPMAKPFDPASCWEEIIRERELEAA